MTELINKSNKVEVIERSKIVFHKSQSSIPAEAITLEPTSIEKEFNEKKELESLKTRVKKRVDESGTMVDKFKKLYNRKIEAQIDSALQQGVKRITDHLILNDD